jgi:hypothetical protein
MLRPTLEPNLLFKIIVENHTNIKLAINADLSKVGVTNVEIGYLSEAYEVDSIHRIFFSKPTQNHPFYTYERHWVGKRKSYELLSVIGDCLIDPMMMTLEKKSFFFKRLRGYGAQWLRLK